MDQSINVSCAIPRPHSHFLRYLLVNRRRCVQVIASHWGHIDVLSAMSIA